MSVDTSLPTSLHGQHLIGGELRREGVANHRAVDPRSGDTLEPAYADASAAEIDAALALASSAHAHTNATHTNASGPEPELRARLLETIAANIEALGDALIDRASRETGLPHPRLIGERGRTCAQLRMFAALVREGSWVDARIDPALPDRQPLPRPDLRRMLIPLGPVAVFGASNFPLAFSVAGGDTASALAAGCPVIVKAHPSHPGTSELVGQAIVQAVRTLGLHPGTFALLHGPSHAVGQALVRHPSLRAVGFTGSLRGGRALLDIAAARPTPIPVFAELGSINPVFVLPAALRERGPAIAAAAAGSLTLGVGQFCTNPGVMLVPTGEHGDAWVEALCQALASVEPGVMLDANILAAYQAGLAQRAALAGVTRLDAPRLHDSRFAAPAVFGCSAQTFMSQSPPSHHQLLDELFGPSAVIVRYQAGTDEPLALAGRFDGQLSATIHAADDDLPLAAELLPLLRARVGRVLFNGFPTGVEVSPAMQHGGPWPASSDPRTTSVGTAAIERFARPVCFQDVPASLLPAELRDDNPRGIWRLVDGVRTR